MTTAKRNDILAALSDLNDGTGDLGIIVDQALADNPLSTADDVRAIVREAREDARVAREAGSRVDLPADRAYVLLYDHGMTIPRVRHLEEEAAPTRLLATGPRLETR